MKKASIISIGNELLSGQTVDTNASWLSRQLLSCGIPAVSFFTAADEAGEIARALNQATEQADIVLVTGGLGPTDDDVTRQALAEFLGVPLEFNSELFDQISQFFARRHLSMAQANKTQAYLPAGANGLANPLGTAPGMMAEAAGKLIACMPGVPKEMECMFLESVAPRLKAYAAGQVVVIGKVMCFGAGESTIADKLGRLMERGRNPLINSTASAGVITLHIVAAAAEKADAEEMVKRQGAQLAEILGDLVYGYDGQSLAEVVGAALKDRKKTLAVAESCTGGLLGKLITDVPGSSDYFKCGWITYCNEAKISELGIRPELIEKHGAVSEQVSRAMARQARLKAGADYAMGITGIAGPGGATEQKPVGLVYISLDCAEKSLCEKHIFSHSRQNVRLRSALAALNMLRTEM